MFMSSFSQKLISGFIGIGNLHVFDCNDTFVMLHQEQIFCISPISNGLFRRRKSACFKIPSEE